MRLSAFCIVGFLSLPGLGNEPGSFSSFSFIFSPFTAELQWFFVCFDLRQEMWVKIRVHWRSLLAKMTWYLLPSLLASRQTMYLPWPPWAAQKKKRNVPISVAPPKVAKASVVICRCCWRYCANLRWCKYNLNCLVSKHSGLQMLPLNVGSIGYPSIKQVK